MPTIVTNRSHFGSDIDDDATMLLGFLCGLLTETTSTLLKERGKILCHNQWTHCVGCQGGNDALKDKVNQLVQINDSVS